MLLYNFIVHGLAQVKGAS